MSADNIQTPLLNEKEGTQTEYKEQFKYIYSSSNWSLTLNESVVPESSQILDICHSLND